MPRSELEESSEAAAAGLEEPLLSAEEREQAGESVRVSIQVVDDDDNGGDDAAPAAATTNAPSSSASARFRRHISITAGNDNDGDGDIIPPEITRHATSLAWAPTTSWLAFFLVPLLILATHALFLYGQTANMWRLTAEWNADVAYDAHSSGKATRYALQALKLPEHDTYTIPDRTRDIRTYTYAHAIHDLWKAKGMKGTFVPRLAAVGLALFSGVWPHLKLFMLLLTWWWSRHPVRRRRMLASLSVLGKWSLVDVVVVCVMIGVVNLQWDFTAEEVMGGVMDTFSILLSLVASQYDPTFACGKLLKYSCEHPSKLKHKLECHACQETVQAAYDHPETTRKMLSGIQTSGGGHAQLSVAGLTGIYAFCGSVILSILLSIIVDWYDLKSRVEWENQRELAMAAGASNEEQTRQVAAPEVSGTLDAGQQQQEECAALLDPSTTTPATSLSSSILSDDGGLQQLMLAENGGTRRKEARSAADLAFDRQVLVESQQTGNTLFQGATFVTMISVVVATLLVTIERRVNGALPDFVHNLLGVVWSKHYSFWGLAWTTGLAGGWDWMLMGTFAWFVIFGPIVRAIMCFKASLVNETPNMTPAVAAAVQRRKRNLSLAIDFVGSFCAWEVYTIALFMVGLLLPGITEGIINDSRCGKLGQSTDKCLEIEYDMKNSFVLVVVSGTMLLAVSQRIRNYKPPY